MTTMRNLTFRALLLLGAVLSASAVVQSGDLQSGRSPGAPPSAPRSSSAKAAIGRPFAAQLESGVSAVAEVGGSRLRLPPSEQVLAVGPDHVVSLLLMGAGGSSLVLRESASGRELIRVNRLEQVTTAVFAGSSLYFAGQMPDGRDSGVSAIDLDDFTIREVIAPATWPDEWGGTGSRNQLRVSPTGATVGVQACGPARPGPVRCFIDVIDAASGTVTRPVTDTALFLWDVNDTALFAASEGRGSVAAFDRRTGKQQWRVESDEFLDHYPTSDGTELIVSYVSVGNGKNIPTRLVLAAIDTTSGAIRNIHAEADSGKPLSLWPELSDDRFAVVGRVNARLVDAFTGGASAVSADLVELASGQVMSNALTVRSPAAPVTDQSVSIVEGFDGATSSLIVPARSANRLAPAAAAHAGRTPTAGANMSFTKDQVLTYGYGATTYPSWVYSVGNGTLLSLWVDPATNNSHMPTFSNAAPSSGQIIFSGSSTSPCSGSSEWLQCAMNTRTTGWRIYIRNFALAPHATNNWHWYDTANACQSSGLCWYARRGMVHETLHAVLVGPNHDEQGEDDTVMGSLDPWATNTGWNNTHLGRCDEAAAQLNYGVKNSAGEYADCYLNVPNHGPIGLKSRATVEKPSYCVGVGASAAAAGRLAIEDSGSYEAVSRMPLSNRTLWFDRKPSGSSTWTRNFASTTVSNAAGNNWTMVFSNSVSGIYDFQAHFDGDTGVDASRSINWPGAVTTETPFSVEWSPSCGTPQPTPTPTPPPTPPPTPRSTPPPTPTPLPTPPGTPPPTPRSTPPPTPTPLPTLPPTPPPTPPPTTGARYFPLAPVRLLDTRWGNGLSGPFNTAVPRTFQVTGRGGVPANAVAVIGNLTVTGQTALGYIALTPNPTANPTISTLNFPVGDDRANGVTIPLGPGGTLSAVYIANSGGQTTALLFDVTGYFAP